MELGNWKFWVSVTVVILVVMWALNRPALAKVKTAVEKQ